MEVTTSQHVDAEELLTENGIEFPVYFRVNSHFYAVYGKRDELVVFDSASIPNIKTRSRSARRDPAPGYKKLIKGLIEDGVEFEIVPFIEFRDRFEKTRNRLENKALEKEQSTQSEEDQP